MATTNLKPSADLSPLQWTPSFGGMDHYDHVDNIPPNSHYLSAYQTGLIDYLETDFISGNPGDILEVTAIQLSIYLRMTWNMSANTYGCRYRLHKADDTFIGEYHHQSPGNTMVPYWIYPVISGLSLTDAELQGLKIKTQSDGIGWGFFQAIYQIQELAPIIATYDPLPGYYKIVEFESLVETDKSLISLATNNIALESVARESIDLVSNATKVITLESKTVKTRAF